MKKILAIFIPFLVFSQLIPYFGKNKVIYNDFKWKEYHTQHFRILFYDRERLPEIAAYAEQCYEKLKLLTGVEIKEKIPIIYYKNHFDFEQTNLYPGIVPEEILGFSEPFRRRVVIPADLSPFQLKRLINHELTHIFEFYILYEGLSPSSIFRIQVPLWMMEGFAEFATGDWEPFPVVTIVDAVANDMVPQISRTGGLIGGSGRVPYDFGHALFDFIRDKYGMTGVRKLWWEVKKYRIVRYTNPIKNTFHLEREIFHSQFKHYLRKRFAEYLRRDMPDDYGVAISPKFPYTYIFSYQLSPSGEVAAILTVNYSQADYDIVLISMRDGRVLRNITPGITLKYQKIRFGYDPSSGRGIAWNKTGEKMAFFGKRTKYYRLFIIDSFKGKLLKQIKLKDVYNPSSPTFTSDGKKVIFTGFQKKNAFIFEVNLDNGRIRRLSPGNFYIKEVAISPDEKTLAFTAIIGKEEHIFIADFPKMSNIRQITFKHGVDINPSFMDNENIIFSSNREGGFDLYSINIKTMEVKRYTRVSTGCFFPQFKDGEIYFTGYFRNNFRLYKTEPDIKQKYIEKERKIAWSTPAAKIQENKIRLRKGIGKLSLDFTTPISIAYSTDGRLFTSAYLSFSDIFADHTLFFYASNDYYYQSYHLGFVNQKRRLWWSLNGFQYKLYYFFGYYYPQYYGYVPSIVLRKLTGANFTFYYPFDFYHRVEGSAGILNIKENTGTLLPSGKYFFYSGTFFNVDLQLVRETTRFKSFGPISGDTLNLYFGKAFPLGGDHKIDNYSISVDARKYINIGRDFLLAFRAYYNGSFGKTPFLSYIGGNNEIRSVGYRAILGTQTFFFNAEFRFPITYITYTAIGDIGPIRGVLFFDLGGAKYGSYPFKFAEGSFPDIRLVDAIASYGYGVELFLFSFPIHIEYVKRTDLRKTLYSVYNFWIGYDF